MGKIMEKGCRVLGAWILVLSGAGILALSGAGIANAQPAGTTCQNINATMSSLATLAATTVSTTHNGLASAKKLAATAASEMTQAASTGSPAVKSAVKTYITDLQSDVDAGHLDVVKINADYSAITAACAASGDPITIAPKGDPATGGGSTAGIQDPVLFGVGGAVVLAGLAFLGLGLRKRSQTGLAEG